LSKCSSLLKRDSNELTICSRSAPTQLLASGDNGIMKSHMWRANCSFAPLVSPPLMLCASHQGPSGFRDAVRASEVADVLVTGFALVILKLYDW
jgi:hypothetical protein